MGHSRSTNIFLTVNLPRTACARASTHNTVVSASKKLSLIDRKTAKIVDGQRSAELVTATATVSDHWDRGESEYVQSLRQPFDNTP